MAESTASYTFAQLYADVSAYRGKGSSPSGTDLTIAKQRVNDAYRKFLALDWSFLSQHKVLKVETGKYIYELPDDFASLRVPFKLFPYMGWANPIQLPMDKFWQYQSFYPRQGIPLFYAFHTEFDERKGLRYTVHFYPTPHVDLSYNYEMKIMPNILVEDSDIPYCPANLSHVLRAYCLSEVELFDEEGAKTVWTDMLLKVLLPQALKENSIREDRTMGNMGGDNSGNLNYPTLHPVYGNTLGLPNQAPYAI
jgi:hypothetical protein